MKLEQKEKKKWCIRNTLHMAIINPSSGLVFQTHKIAALCITEAEGSLLVLSHRLHCLN